MSDTPDTARIDVAPIDFTRADFAPEVEVRAAACSHCGRPLVDAYFTYGPNVHCASCNAGLRAAIARGPGVQGLIRGLGFGLAAAVGGAVLWAVVTEATGYSIGLIAIAVGWLVGNAVRRGSGGFGGLPFQGMAIALTYLAIVSSYVPEILVVMEQRQAESAEAVESWDESTDGSGSDVRRSQSDGDPIRTWIAAFALAVALPFLMGLDNAIGLLIIGIALFEAWRINRAALPDTLGPFRIGHGLSPSAPGRA